MKTAGRTARYRPDAHRGLLLRAGCLAGLISGLVGVGGGVVMVPALTSARVGLPARTAAGTSLAAILPIAAVGAITYAGHGDVDAYVTGLVVAGSVAGAMVGARLAQVVPERTLLLLFSVLTFAVAVRLAVPTGLPGHTAAVGHSAVHGVGLVAVGVLAGLLSGLLGVGGGVIVVPALVLLFSVAQQAAQGISLAAIIPTGLTGALMHRAAGSIRVDAVRLLAAGGVVGAVAGGLLAVHLPETPLRLIFSAYTALMAARVAWSVR